MDKLCRKYNLSYKQLLTGPITQQHKDLIKELNSSTLTEEKVLHGYNIISSQRIQQIKRTVVSKEPKVDYIIVQYSTNNKRLAEFSSTAQASRETGVNAGNISLACRGKVQRAGGYIWKKEEI